MSKAPLSETSVEYLQTACGCLEATPLSPGLYEATIFKAGVLPGTGNGIGAVIFCPGDILQIALPQFLNLKAYLHQRHNPPGGHPLAALLGCFHDTQFVEDHIVATLRVCGSPLGERLTHYLGRVLSHSREASGQPFARLSLDITVATEVQRSPASDQRRVRRILSVKHALIG